MEVTFYFHESILLPWKLFVYFNGSNNLLPSFYFHGGELTFYQQTFMEVKINFHETMFTSKDNAIF